MRSLLRSTRSRSAVAVVVATSLATLTGCGEDTPTIEISDARMSVPANEQAAVYLDLHNPGGIDDELVSAYSSASPMIHLHASNIAEDGVASMSKVDPVVVPAGGTLRLEPGGNHLMMMYPEPVAVGDEVELTLNFANAGNVTTSVEVLDVVEPSDP